MLPKFSILHREEEHSYNNIYQAQKTVNFSRLCIGSKSGEIRLLLALAKLLAEPFYVLYVLVVPRGEAKAGRYQSVELSYEELKVFLENFTEFFEHDGRMNLWIKERDGQGLLVFDRHNYVYAYGDLNSYQKILISDAYSEGEFMFSVLHTHYYHEEYDAHARGVIDYFDWSYSPLREGDYE